MVKSWITAQNEEELHLNLYILHNVKLINTRLAPLESQRSLVNMLPLRHHFRIV